jgi:signal transduction histidine kinase
MSVSALDKTQISGFNRTVVDNITSLINESISSLKYTSNNLSPHILDSFGLTSAINSFIENIRRLGKMDITFSSNIDDCRFESQIETNIYRIICELFQNTVKHAVASNVSLMIHFADNKMIIQYFDDGVGFDPEDSSKLNGMGLSNMHSRLKALNGEIDFRRIQPRGMMTTITIKTKQTGTVHAKD